MAFKMFDFQCNYCGTSFEALKWQDNTGDEISNPKCPKCGDKNVDIKPNFAGYNIYGDNSASQRPKQAGSFKRSKK